VLTSGSFGSRSPASSIERDDPAYEGQREYTALFLKIYDHLILFLRHAGRVAVPDDSPGGGVPAALGHRHLDVGPGTGYFLGTSPHA
jgi:hypothetical protein